MAGPGEGTVPMVGSVEEMLSLSPDQSFEFSDDLDVGVVEEDSQNLAPEEAEELNPDMPGNGLPNSPASQVANVLPAGAPVAKKLPETMQVGQTEYRVDASGEPGSITPEVANAIMQNRSDQGALDKERNQNQKLSTDLAELKGQMQGLSTMLAERGGEKPAETPAESPNVALDEESQRTDKFLEQRFDSLFGEGQGRETLDALRRQNEIQMVRNLPNAVNPALQEMIDEIGRQGSTLQNLDAMAAGTRAQQAAVSHGTAIFPDVPQEILMNTYNDVLKSLGVPEERQNDVFVMKPVMVAAGMIARQGLADAGNLPAQTGLPEGTDVDGTDGRSAAPSSTSSFPAAVHGGAGSVGTPSSVAGEGQRGFGSARSGIPMTQNPTTAMINRIKEKAGQ